MAINITDFDKIWASSSPLTPYSFSDANYEEGWNFVGSTPPARQMWDGYMKWSDEKQQWIVNNFLPLSGGTLTGAVVGNPLTLTADDGNGNSADLVLNPNGSLTWNGKEVERVNEIDMLQSNASYVRFESGLQICWGSETGVANTNVTITYPAPFSASPRVTLSVGSNTVTYGWSNNGATAVVLKTSSTSGVIVYYMAIGKWN